MEHCKEPVIFSLTRNKFAMNVKMSSLKQVLEELFKRRQWQRRIEIHEVWNFWNEMVGMEISVQAQPYLIRGTVLWVNVSDCIWMQHLHMQKNQLLTQINERLKGDNLTDIRFRLDSSLGYETTDKHR